MNIFNFLLGLCFVAALSACEKKSESQSSNPAISPTSSKGPAQAGTGDSGGGNTYHGKPLESYIQKPQELAAYKNVVQRVYDNSILDIQSLFSYVLAGKTWYFVPGPLSGLPSHQIGSAVSTDQAALQDFTQVWIDQDIFDKMSEADKGKLILHEILIGIKFLKFDAPLTGCLAIFFISKSNDYCYSQYDNQRTGAPANLTEMDYSDVRKLTEHLLTTDLSEIADNGMEWRTLFHKGNFHFPAMYFPTLEDSQDSTHQQNLANVKHSMELGYQPTYGYSMDDLYEVVPGWQRGTPVPEGTVWKSTSKCKVEITKNGQDFNLKVQVGSYKIESNISHHLYDGTTWDHRYSWINGQLYWNRELAPRVSIAPSPSAPLRERMDSIDAHFDSVGNLKAVLIKEWYIRAPGSTHGSYDDEILKGHYYVCSLFPEIKFQKNQGPRKNYW